MCGAALARAQPDVPDGFAVESVVLEPFSFLPMGFAFLPDGRILLIEKHGLVRLATPGNTASAIVALIPNVTTQAERGLLGIAVDPDWPARPYIYLHSTRLGSTVHITMYTASGDLSDPLSMDLTFGSPFTLLNDIPDLNTNHNGGTLRFGTDGFLYVSLGDDGSSCAAQNLIEPLGKILRLDVSTMPRIGTGPPPKAAITPASNPFPGGESERLVYAQGLRNPFRFTIDPNTGNLYIGDVGETTWEELDELVQDGYTGDNFGWPEFEGPLQDPDPFSTDCSTPPFKEPIHVYPNPPMDVAAVICGPRYRSNPPAQHSFPAAYDGDLFFADFYGSGIRRLKVNGASWTLADSVAGQPSALAWAANLSQIVELQQGPDGALYVLSFVNGGTPRGLHRIVNTLASAVHDRADAGSLRVRGLPNPARGGVGVRFEYELGRFTSAGIRIYDPAGRLVRTLALRAASGSVAWDGRAQDGERVRPGVYFYELRTAAGERQAGKIVLGQ
jgi:glucose/arabinose dehydrogenase